MIPTRRGVLERGLPQRTCAKSHSVPPSAPGLSSGRAPVVMTRTDSTHLPSSPRAVVRRLPSSPNLPHWRSWRSLAWRCLFVVAECNQSNL
jgi:hypothetical protein